MHKPQGPIYSGSENIWILYDCLGNKQTIELYEDVLDKSLTEYRKYIEYLEKASHSHKPSR